MVVPAAALRPLTGSWETISPTGRLLSVVPPSTIWNCADTTLASALACSRVIPVRGGTLYMVSPAPPKKLTHKNTPMPATNTTTATMARMMGRRLPPRSG